jgi:predicted nucleic acid-binding protein
MNVVDSSGWLEYFTDGPNAGAYRSAIKDEGNLIVPTICLYEVFKITLARAGEPEALNVAGLMSFGQIVDLDREIALAAGQISCKEKLPMADSIIYATAQARDAVLWTQDEHLNDLPGVKFIKKK